MELTLKPKTGCQKITQVIRTQPESQTKMRGRRGLQQKSDLIIPHCGSWNLSKELPHHRHKKIKSNTKKCIERYKERNKIEERQKMEI
jgi:hypothetical protein